MNAIELRGLTKRYGRRRGIEDLSFTVEEGEVFGLLGPEGAGKTTVLRALLDLVRPTSGSASILGLDSRRGGRRLRAQVGYVPGEVQYYEHMRVGHLLRYAAGFYGADGKKRVNLLADALELDLGGAVDALSPGGRKQVGLAQALLHQPRVLLLDEPTAGMDPRMEEKLLRLLHQEHRRGVTILLASRVFSQVQRLCQRAAVLREGRLTDVHAVSQLRDSSCCRVRCEGAGMKAKQFTLEGISGLTVDELGAEFLYRGGTNRLLKALARVPMTNLRLSEPALEEGFLRGEEGGEGQ